MVGNSRFQKKANRSLILNYLYYYGPHSRHILAKELGLQGSTVTNITQALMKEGMVIECGSSLELMNDDSKKNRGSGRRPVEIGLSPGYGCIIGLDLQVDYSVTVIYDFAGRIIYSEKKLYEQKETGFLVLLKKTVDDICQSLEFPVLGLGLALPGIINSPGGIIIDCWTHNLENQDLSTWLDSTFPFPVILENDANCAALNILKKMKTQKKGVLDSSFLYLLPRFHNPSLVPETQPSVGIGMGLVINGELYRGENFRAGEYQSILTLPSQSHSRQLSLTDEKLKLACDNEIIQEEIIKELMNNMKLLLQILDPHSLYMGGDLSGKEKMIRPILTDDSLSDKYPIEVRDKDSHDTAQGAGCLVFEKLFAIPQVGNSHKEV